MNTRSVDWWNHHQHCRHWYLAADSLQPYIGSFLPWSGSHIMFLPTSSFRSSAHEEYKDQILWQLAISPSISLTEERPWVAKYTLLYLAHAPFLALYFFSLGNCGRFRYDYCGASRPMLPQGNASDGSRTIWGGPETLALKEESVKAGLAPMLHQSSPWHRKRERLQTSR